LLNEFLLLGKPAKISLEPIQLDEFLCELQLLLEAEGADKGVQFTFTTPQVAPINGDIGQLTQIVMNLVRNAVEAVAEGGHVQISLSEWNQWVVLGILDNGSGVPSDVMERLFEPFYTTKSIGTGLGLPVSQAIAHNHGGHIEVENINGGAEFRLYLPKTQDAHDGVVDVVVFAADSIFVNTCERSLRAVGLRVVGCTAHDETVEAVKNRHPKVLLLGPHAGSTAADLCSGTNGVNVLYTGNPPTGDRGQGCTVNVSTVDFAKIVADVLALVNANTMDKDDKQVI
jgi:hypothetical protein